MHWMLYSGARKPRALRAIDARKSANSWSLPRASSTFSSRSRTRASGRFSATALFAKAMAAVAQLGGTAGRDVVDQAGLECFAGADVAARRHHLERLGDPDEAGQALRAARAGQQAEVDLGQAELRRVDSDAVVARRARLRGRRRARCRGSRRSPAPAAFSIAACTSWRPAAFGTLPPNSLMSAPAMNVRPSQITTTAFAPSSTALLIPSNKPWRTCQLRALTGGLSTMTSAMSPTSAATVSRRTDSEIAVMPPVKHPEPVRPDSGSDYAGVRPLV